MPFSKSTSEDAGRKGGQARSDKKARSSRKNGRRGGRRPSRTLVERLLGRTLSFDEQQAINKVWGDNRWLFAIEAKALQDFFQVATYPYDAVMTCPYDTVIWQRKSGRMPKNIRYLVAKFRLSALYLLGQYRAKVKAKDYFVVTEQRSPEECRAWEQRPNIRDNINAPPCPPRRYRISFRRHPLYRSVVRYVAEDPTITAEELYEIGGGAYGHPAVKAMLEYVRVLHSAAPPPPTQPLPANSVPQEPAIPPIEPSRQDAARGLRARFMPKK